MAKVEIEKGVTVPESLIGETENETLSFDFWYGKLGCELISTILKAEPFTIVVNDSNGNAAYVPCFKRKILPGLTFFCGYPYTRVFGDHKFFFDNIDLVIKKCYQHHIARIELTYSGGAARKKKLARWIGRTSPPTRALHPG